ncbi:IQ motif, EF-hand binding site [Plasmopara halstedii]|uniref:IQ motif, EF-hand binding site n=1 Tax=Plasmopara halstedii TaxID=4781 RepID=A0A0P1AZ30_PLAHL|nr:IQ motif, EF-hand binding site [Plasmopara halstedii]CEG46541.1 IQ motif, EF-hand binding site [Plasmopara halstedii]|eukprot:XP_024582910.1 IQ motif, EF-hand binding site [Plasmopara halstedii]
MAWVLRLNEVAERNLIDGFFRETERASAARLQEIRAATCLKSFWRGYRCRSLLRFLHESCTKIQALYHGIRSRDLCANLRADRAQQMREHLYDHAATLIQKIVRGRQSRRNRVDFYARRRYIDSVFIKSNALRATMEIDFEAHKAKAREREEKESAEEFMAAIFNAHHLLSTATQPGIFRSPYGELYSAKAFDIPVEEHIAGAFKSQRSKMMADERKSKQRMKKSVDSHGEKISVPRPFGKLNGGAREVQVPPLLRPVGNVANRILALIIIGNPLKVSCSDIAVINSCSYSNADYLAMKEEDKYCIVNHLEKAGIGNILSRALYFRSSDTLMLDVLLKPSEFRKNSIVGSPGSSKSTTCWIFACKSLKKNQKSVAWMRRNAPALF